MNVIKFKIIMILITGRVELIVIDNNQRKRFIEKNSNTEKMYYAV